MASDSETEHDEANDWEEWDEERGGESTEPSKCLFCVSSFDTPASVFDHCKVAHSFDLSDIRQQFKLDFLDSIKVVNFVRKQVLKLRCINCDEQHATDSALIQHMSSAGHFILPSVPDPLSDLQWKSEQYLTPVLENDPLLYSLEDDMDDDVEMDVDTHDIYDLESSQRLKLLSAMAASELQTAPGREAAMDSDEIFNLLAEVTPEALPATAGSSGEDEGSSMADKMEIEDAAIVDRLRTGGSKGRNRVKFGGVVEREVERVDSNYFSSYSAFGIHREMLSDKVRTEAYRDSLLLNPSLVKDAVVLDVGCGTGILSLFAAKAGASKVVSIDGSAKILRIARQVAGDNGLLAAGQEGSSPDGIITFVEGKVEDLVSKDAAMVPLSRGSVDILVSEWMGYCLLFESMLPSVLLARDTWLKPGGAILPDIAKMYLAGFGKGGTSLPFWDDVYGFNMSAIGKKVVEECSAFPLVDIVPGQDVVTHPALIQTFDMATMTEEDIDFTADFHLMPRTRHFPPADGAAMSEDSNLCYGVVVWFDVDFSRRFCKEMEVTMSTSPFEPRTHWLQTILTFAQPVPLIIDPTDESPSLAADHLTGRAAAQSIKGRISIARSSRHRSIDISLEVSAVMRDGTVRDLPAQIFDI